MQWWWMSLWEGTNTSWQPVLEKKKSKYAMSTCTGHYWTLSKGNLDTQVTFSFHPQYFQYILRKWPQMSQSPGLSIEEKYRSIFVCVLHSEIKIKTLHINPLYLNLLMFGINKWAQLEKEKKIEFRPATRKMWQVEGQELYQYADIGTIPCNYMYEVQQRVKCQAVRGCVRSTGNQNIHRLCNYR